MFYIVAMGQGEKYLKTETIIALPRETIITVIMNMEFEDGPAAKVLTKNGDLYHIPRESFVDMVTCLD